MLDLFFTPKDAEDNIVVRFKGELLENNKGDKFRIEWEKTEGFDLYSSALLMDLKECICALNP